VKVGILLRRAGSYFWKPPSTPCRPESSAAAVLGSDTRQQRERDRTGGRVREDGTVPMNRTAACVGLFFVGALNVFFVDFFAFLACSKISLGVTTTKGGWGRGARRGEHRKPKTHTT